MRFGVQLGVDAPVHPDALTELALGAERLRFESFWVGDHFVIPQAIDDGAHRRDVGGTQRFADRSRASIAEPVTTLCYLAATVRRLRLGLAVLVVPLRNPVQSAKMLANLDVLSGGRLDIGIGSGWIEAEFEALRTPPFAERGRVTDEYLDLMIELWAADEPSFKGEYYEIRGVTMYPKPVQRPHPPLWVGGNGLRALRRAARTGQGWMPLFQEPDVLPERLRLLRELCEDQGREAGELRVAVGCRFSFHDGGGADRPRLSGTPQQIRDDVRRYEDAGIEELHLISATPNLRVGDALAAWDRFDHEVIGWL